VPFVSNCCLTDDLTLFCAHRISLSPRRPMWWRTT
jgi:hypothetical protein